MGCRHLRQPGAARPHRQLQGDRRPDRRRRHLEHRHGRICDSRCPLRRRARICGRAAGRALRGDRRPGPGRRDRRRLHPRLVAHRPQVRLCGAGDEAQAAVPAELPVAAAGRRQAGDRAPRRERGQRRAALHDPANCGCGGRHRAVGLVDRSRRARRDRARGRAGDPRLRVSGAASGADQRPPAAAALRPEGGGRPALAAGYAAATASSERHQRQPVVGQVRGRRRSRGDRPDARAGARRRPGGRCSCARSRRDSPSDTR